MSDARLRWLAMLVTAALAVVVGIGSVTGSRAAATSLEATALGELAKVGLDGVEVDFEGREATLSDGSHADLLEAGHLVEAIPGVRSVRVIDNPDRGRPAASAPAPSADVKASIELRRQPGRVSVSGVVPDADAAAAIKSGSALIFDSMVSGDLRVDSSAKNVAWVAALPTILADVVGVGNLAIAIDAAGTVTIRGTIESPAGRRKITALISSALPKSKVVNQMTIDRGRLNGADAAILNSSTVYFDQGASYITYVAAPTLNELAQMLQRNRRLSLEIVGYSGPKDPVAGKRLSDQRVKTAKDYLVAIGIDADRLTARSFVPGGRTAVDPAAEQFRRVDFIVKRK